MKKSQPRSRQSQKSSQSRKGISKEYKALYDGPSSFMRARRPHLFSDTVAVDRPQLDRDRLEYYLETLTSRKQETAFEHFARRLAEKEICPNLLPQTGPTGGGDSKVDTETGCAKKNVSHLMRVPKSCRD